MTGLKSRTLSKSLADAIASAWNDVEHMERNMDYQASKDACGHPVATVAKDYGSRTYRVCLEWDTNDVRDSISQGHTFHAFVAGYLQAHARFYNVIRAGDHSIPE